MATCLEIITDALVWRGVLAEGRSPSAKQTVSAMSVLKGLYLELINSGALGRLHNVSPVETYTARPGDRIINTSVPPITVILPETVEAWGDYAAIQPKNHSVVVIIGASPGSYLYDTNSAAWSQVEGLEPENYAPLSSDLSEGLKAAVCARLRYPGLPVDAAAVNAARNFYVTLTHHYTEGREECAPYRPFCDYRTDWC